MGGVLANSFQVIIQLLFDLYLYVLLLRLLLQWCHSSWYNPFTQFIIVLSNPVVNGVRRVIPRRSGLDWSVVAPVILLQLIESILVFWLATGGWPGAFGVIVMVIAALGTKVVHLYIAAIIVGAILSFIPSRHPHPIGVIAMTLVGPLYQRLHRYWRPIVSGFDLSPFVIFVVLLLINMLIWYPLASWGLRLALSR